MEIKLLFRKNENIVAERFNDRLLLFDLDTNLPFILNPVASFIFLNTDGLKRSKEIADMVSQEFDVELEQALSDVENLNKEFQQKRIVSRIKYKMEKKIGSE